MTRNNHRSPRGYNNAVTSTSSAPARIDLDANATTAVHPDVLAAMLPWLSVSANASSAHYGGQRARSAVERARMQVAKLLGCTAKEVVFTSGGTESNNLALCGTLQPLLDAGSPVHIITTAIEHHAVSHVAESLAARYGSRGFSVTTIAPTADGSVSAEDVAAALTPETRLVSVMLANNETGVIQPLGRIARHVKDFAARHSTQIVMHSDGVQAAGKLPIDLAGEFKNVDLLSLSGHKMYAPQGTGVLFVRDGVKLAPLFHGGPHERQRRAGTENTAGIVALGAAAELARNFLAATTDHSPAQLAALRDTLEDGLLAAIPGTQVNGSTTNRTPNTTNLRFPIDNAEPLLYALDMEGIAASFGSACSSGAAEASHVLTAMGLTPAEARRSLRLSLSRFTTADEIARVLTVVPQVIARMLAVK